MRPRIGIPGRRADQVGILRFSGTIAAEAICEAVWAGGGEPLILHGPAADPRMELKERLRLFDGILLPGGADVGPHRYDSAPHAEITDVVDFQDEYDLAVMQELLVGTQPVLAICRGMQVLNVVTGGSLVPHMDDPGSVHRDTVHEVTAYPDSRLAGVIGTEPVPVSSYHHQSIDRLGSYLTVAATAADGLVEAIEHPNRGIVAVQWHPEDLFADHPHDLRLFEDLVERAQRHRQEAA